MRSHNFLAVEPLKIHSSQEALGKEPSDNSVNRGLKLQPHNAIVRAKSLTPHAQEPGRQWKRSAARRGDEQRRRNLFGYWYT